MKDAAELHRQAMALYDDYLHVAGQGHAQEAQRFLLQAFELEKRAAALLAPDEGLEPTRSVIHRSAASLALQYEDLDGAEKLIYRALVGTPPEEIANELRDLLEDVRFRQHLRARDLELGPNEFEFFLSGGEVGAGIANAEDFILRVDRVQSLIYRTTERILREPYRERGRRKEERKELLELFVSAPRAGSFSVSFVIGRSRNISLPGIDLAEKVVSEVLECVDLYDRSEEEALRTRIANEAYYRNFVALTRSIAPDGKRIGRIGFSVMRNGVKRSAVLNPRLTPPRRRAKGQRERTVDLRGTLRYADSLKEAAGDIILVDDRGKRHRLVVPKGMMSDIVRPLWERRVVARVIKRKQSFHLETIDLATDED